MGVVRGTPVVGAARQIRWRPSSPSCIWHGRWCCAWRGAGEAVAARASGWPAFSYRKKAGRREYVRVFLEETEEGLIARKFTREGAGLLTSLTETDGFAELPETTTSVSPGDRLRVLPFAAVL